ncbi:MAG: ComF family protein [Limnothrix sp.]
MFDRFLSLFLQEKCPLCDRPAENVVCRDCDRQLKKCQFPNPKTNWQKPLPLFLWGRYDDALKRAIATMKFNNNPQLGMWLGQQLGEKWRKTFPQSPKLTIMPIPMHSAKQQERGFNQAELISRQFAQVTGFRHDTKALVRTKATQSLFKLSLAQRQQEISQAFTLSPNARQKIGDRPVLLIDDIYTSGTTAKEAQATLQKQGIKVWGLAAIATPKLSQPKAH